MNPNLIKQIDEPIKAQLMIDKANQCIERNQGRRFHGYTGTVAVDSHYLGRITEAIYEVNSAAFPTDAKANLVNVLRAAGALLLSLVAVDGGKVVGHIAFSPVEIRSEEVSYCLRTIPKVHRYSPPSRRTLPITLFLVFVPEI